MRVMFQRIIISTATVILLASSAFSQIQNLFQTNYEAYNFDFNGSGARAMGMGNAFLGVSDDITAMGWNPAGLYKMETPTIGFTYSSLHPRGSFSSERLNFTTLTFTGQRENFNHGGTFGALTSANFLAPVRIKNHPFVGFVAYTRNSNEYQKQGYVLDQIEVFPIFNQAGTFLYTDTVNENVNIVTQLEGGIDAVNVGFGTRIRENLAFGASLNVYAGQVQRATDALITGDNLPVNNFQHGQLALVATQDDSDKFSGFNVTLGLKLDGEKFDAGLVARTPFSLNQKGENLSTSIVNVNGVPLTTDTTYAIDLLTKYDIPLMLGFGVGYQMTEKWKLAADFEYRHFSSSKIKIRQNLILVPGGTNIEEFTVLSPQQWQWSNIFAVRTGTEYMQKTGIGTIPLRAGFGYSPIPRPNVDPLGNRSTATSFMITLGTGIHWSQIKLDLGYMYKSYNVQDGSFLAEEKNQNHFLDVSFTGYF